jgi:Domain of unknown function (DUF4167)
MVTLRFEAWSSDIRFSRPGSFSMIENKPRTVKLIECFLSILRRGCPAPCYSVALTDQRNEPRESKHEDREHFDCAVSRTLSRGPDIGRLGASSGVGGGRCKVSGSGPSAISDRPRIRRYEERSCTCLPSLPRGPWLSSLAHVARLRIEQNESPQRFAKGALGPGARPLKGFEALNGSYENYLVLAQEEARSENVVGAENYYQHAEHYFRLMSANRAAT